MKPLTLGGEGESVWEHTAMKPLTYIYRTKEKPAVKLGGWKKGNKTRSLIIIFLSGYTTNNS